VAEGVSRLEGDHGVVERGERFLELVKGLREVWNVRGKRVLLIILFYKL
jgi:hypothetical protein